MHAAMDLCLDAEEKARLWQRIELAAAEEQPPAMEENPMKHRSANKVIRITLLAAVIAGLLTVGAYAAGFLGREAIVIPEAEAETERGETLVSITQPQAVPEEMDAAVKEKVDNARAAWSEWRTWRETGSELPREPEVFHGPENTVSSAWVENGDGSYTLYFFDEAGYQETLAYYDPQSETDPDFAACHPIETRQVSAEEMAAWEAYVAYVNQSYGDYDFNYDIHNEQEAEKLEEIAAKYGLRLRHGSTLLWSKETLAESEAEINARTGRALYTDTSDPRFLNNKELCERVSTECCHGPFFRQTPRGFDKVYYFDEGTFCVSYDQQLPDGRRLRCYGYNSMYATLSSGREVVTLIEGPERFQTRTHTAPDGTELTILQKDGEAFLYVYLPDSFFELHIQADSPLSDTDVNAVADNLNYSNIGQ